MDDLTKEIKTRINERYRSIREFAKEADIPYTTILTAFSKGVNGTAVEKVLKMCSMLGIDINEYSRDMTRKGSAENNNEHFAQIVVGRSMEPRIFDGDMVIVRKQNDVESGDIAVIRVKEDVTTKKIVKQENGVLLVGLNAAAFTPEYYPYEDVEILGKVIEIRGKVDGWDK